MTDELASAGSGGPDTDPSSKLPIVLRMDDADEPADVVDALALADFATGRHRWARSVWLDRVRADAPLLPPAARLLRSASERGRDTHLAGGGDWLLHATRWRDRTARVTVTATSDELARTVLEQATSGAVEDPRPEDQAVPIGFWHRTQHGAQRTARAIDVTPWPAIRRNYAGRVADVVDRLMAIEPADLAGRLLLVHGPPGTGKTTALRALAHAWRRWCQVDCVLDPERLFSDPGYLLDVTLGEEDRRRRWRLLILEDCDELIRAEAKQATGQALSRLLNLTDGLLGQGLDVLVAITTNEELSRLHPAVVRPGRCLAEIEIGRLPRAEAVAWLGATAGIGPDGATLAELFQLRGELQKVERSEPVKVVGLYL